MDIGAWLESLGLGDYEAVFRENAVDADVLPDLTAEDLKDLGIAAVGHRRKILTAITRLAEAENDKAATSAQEPAREAAGERRHVAVLFADLVGYTRLTEELGAEAMHVLLGDYFFRVDAIIERAGGRVDKHIGDCVMAVFGAPLAHGDDAERAVLAALEIRKAIPELSATAGREIGVHLGVTTGVVVASYVGAGDAAEYTVTGDSVNLASRLTDAAAPDEILISDGLHRALESRLICEAAGTLKVKGFAAPVPAWRLIDLSEDRGERAPFVGRRAELRQFASILRACREDGAGHVVRLRGEAGIGKTRLGEEFERMAQEDGFARHRGLVLDFGVETGRDAVRAIVRDILGVTARTPAARIGKTVTEAIERRVVSADMEVHLNDLLDAPQPDHLRALYNAMDIERRQQGRGAAIAQILRWATARQPRLLIVEDVHWAKAPLLRALAHMAQAVGDCPAILVISSRVEGDPLDRVWRSSVLGTPFTTVDLSPLRVEEAKLICETSLHDQAQIEGLVARAEGNPLFLEQLLRHSQQAEGEGVPGSIQSLVQASVDQLSAADKQAIQAASVIGQRVDPALLRRLIVSPRFDPAELVEKSLLRPHGQDYLFVHALIRDAVYGSLLTQNRSALHRRAAAWFQDRDLRLHAEHLGLAGAPEAAAAYLAAAQDEIRKYHHETALSLIERGLSLAEAPEARGPLQLLEGQTLHDLGRMSDAAASCQVALEAAASSVDRCRALIGLAGVKRVTEDIDGAIEDLAEAETAAAAEGLLAERSRICNLRGNLLFPRGDLEGCLRAHDESLGFARRAGRRDLEAAALGGLGDAEYVHGRMASARRRLEACVEVAREEGLGRIEVANQAQVAHTMFYTGSLEAAYTAASAAIEAALNVGHVRAEINARAAVHGACFALARHEESLRLARRQNEAIDRLGAFRFRQINFINKGRALQGLDRTEEAIANFEEALQFARESGFAFWGPAIASGYACVIGEPARKAELMAEAEAGIAAGCVGHNQFYVYADGIDVAFELGDAVMLRSYVERAAAYPSGETVVWNAFHAARGRWLLHRLAPGAEEAASAARNELAKLGDELKIRYWPTPELGAG